MNLRGKIHYIIELIENYKDWYLILFYRVFQRVPKKIRLRNGLIIIGRTKSSITDLVDEIFIKEVYNPPHLKIKPGDTVIDIGANIGIFSLYAAKKGATNIYCAEPLPGIIPLIRKNFVNNNLKTPTIIRRGISYKNGNAKLYLGDLDSHALLFNHNHAGTFHKYVEIKTISLEDLLSELKIRSVDFLKIDCEGCEGYIINSTPKKIWKGIKRVAIEYHNDVSNLSSEQIIEKLKLFGYKTKINESDNLFGYIYAWR
jgi:FkbM family methyltransferase